MSRTSSASGELDPADLLARGARHDVEAAQLVEDGPADEREGVGLEGDAPLGIEGARRVDQADGADLEELVVVDVRRQAGGDAVRHVAYERKILLRKLVPIQLVSSGSLAFGVLLHASGRGRHGCIRTLLRAGYRRVQTTP
jgi:hypothetical protein